MLNWRRLRNKRPKHTQSIKMAEDAEPMQHVIQFLRSLGIEPASSFKLLAMRAGFVQLCFAKQGIAESVKALVGRGLVGVFALAPAESATP